MCYLSQLMYIDVLPESCCNPFVAWSSSCAPEHLPLEPSRLCALSATGAAQSARGLVKQLNISIKYPWRMMFGRSRNNYSNYSNYSNYKLKLKTTIIWDIWRWRGCWGITSLAPLDWPLRSRPVLQAAIQHLKDIAETFGSQWTVEHLLLRLRGLLDSHQRHSDCDFLPYCV
jgi:hypothetical protein